MRWGLAMMWGECDCRVWTVECGATIKSLIWWVECHTVTVSPLSSLLSPTPSQLGTGDYNWLVLNWLCQYSRELGVTTSCVLVSWCRHWYSFYSGLSDDMKDWRSSKLRGGTVPSSTWREAPGHTLYTWSHWVQPCTACTDFSVLPRTLDG